MDEVHEPNGKERATMVRVRVDPGITATHGYGVCVRTQEARAPAP